MTRKGIILFFTIAFPFALPVFGQSSLIAGALKGPTGIGMIRIFESPPSLPEGLSLKALAVASADLMTAKIATGEVDFATLPLNTAAKLYTNGLPYALCAVIGNGMVSLIVSDDTICSPADLAGKELYVAGQGAGPEFVIKYILNKAGLDPEKDLRLAFSMPYPEMTASIIAGRIRYAILPEPFASQALIGNPSLKTAFDIQGTFQAYSGMKTNYPMSVLVAKKSLLSGRPGAVADFLKAYRASIDFVLANPGEAAVLVEKHDLGLKAAVAKIAIPRSNYTFRTARDAKEDIESMLKVFLSYAPNSIGGRLPDEAFYAF